MSDLHLIAAVALLTFALRSSFILLAATRALPERADQIIAQLKPSAFAALAATALAGNGGIATPHLLAVIVIAWTARRISLLSAFALGFVIFLLGIHLL